MNEIMQERRERLMGKAYRLFYDQPVHIMRGEGRTRYRDVCLHLPFFNLLRCEANFREHLDESLIITDRVKKRIYQ